LSNELENWLDEFHALNPSTIQQVEDTGKKAFKNDLFGDILPALDRRDIKYYSMLTDEQKKDISIWTLTRWMSSIERGAEDQIITVNTIVNENSLALGSQKSENSFGSNSHKELEWMLLAITGTGKREKHVWPAAPKGIKKNPVEEALLKINPMLKDDELELLQQINSREELERYFKDNAFDDKTIKEIFKGETKGK